jgi:hypothetical protein
VKWTLFALLTGCSALIHPDPSRLDGEDGGIVIRIDSGGADSGPTPTLDGGIDAGSDAGSDGGNTCSPADRPRCEGDVLVACDSTGRPSRIDCQSRMQYCDEDRCREWECTPGESVCEGSRLETCNDRGSGAEETGCEFGCADGRSCATTPVCPGLPPLSISVGDTQTIDTCPLSDFATPEADRTMGCGDTHANGGDRVFTLTLTARTALLIDLLDVTEGVSIDTVLYVRTSCDDMGSQVACSDDIPCASSDIRTGCSSSGLQVRQSRITNIFEPGTYYIVIDQYLYTGFTCGRMRLSVQSIATMLP